MRYSNDPAPRWDRITGVVLWLAAGCALVSPMLRLFVEDCFWEQGCNSSQAPRLSASLLAAFVLAVPMGWGACAALKRIFDRSGQ
jgi:hypothetical protein